MDIKELMKQEQSAINKLLKEKDKFEDLFAKEKKATGSLKTEIAELKDKYNKIIELIKLSQKKDNEEVK